MISLYMSQITWLHRIPAGIKLVSVAALSILVLSIDRWEPLTFVFLAGCLVAASLGGQGILRVWDLRALLPIIVAIGVLQAFVASIDAALLSVLRILSMVLLADLVTMTTSMQAMMRAVLPAFSPLRWVGISPKRLSLAVALMIRFIPLLVAQWQAQRDAWRSRSKRKPGFRLLVPFIAQAMRRTHQVAESVAARTMQ